MLFVLLFLLSLNFAVEFKVNEIRTQVKFSYRFIVFEERVIFAIRFLGDLPFFLFAHVNFLRMEEFLKVFLFEFGNFVEFKRVFGKLGSSEPFFPFSGGFGDIVNDTIVVAVDFFFKELGETTLSMLVSPEVA